MLGMRGMVCAVALLALPAITWANGSTCQVDASTVTVQTAWTSPLAAELTPTVTQLGGASGVLAQSFDEALSVDSVLTRIRLDGCRAVASITPAAAPAANPVDPAAYKPETAYDNRPWRFNMTQGGKRMTADEFDAWMKARGVRVVGRRDASSPAPEAAPAPEGK
ncbi:MAG: hypothetical protein K8F33_10085 [Thermomonas sp.]|uniref:hypothetical protein n=1 Tax=Thermomonas sp. TaxID=1971895 RepID=UPI001DD22028|nr:hypothetical protein [Thermomonas sp.]MBZ0088428.1 hypothetical protein [Thermomonas sp.]